MTSKRDGVRARASWRIQANERHLERKGAVSSLNLAYKTRLLARNSSSRLDWDWRSSDRDLPPKSSQFSPVWPT